MNWKTQILLMGTAVGAAVGFGTAFLLARSAERENREALPEISTGEALGVAVAIIGVIRGITALGDGKSKKK
jgi:threonine/homoserine/homoserine lactone efflux protein